MKRDVGYNRLVGGEERMIAYNPGIHGKQAPLIVQKVVNCEPDVVQAARDQIVSGMVAMRDAVLSAAETLGEAIYFMNEQRKREDERRKRTWKE
jgi:hypothetical protein